MLATKDRDACTQAIRAFSEKNLEVRNNLPRSAKSHDAPRRACPWQPETASGEVETDGTKLVPADDDPHR